MKLESNPTFQAHVAVLGAGPIGLAAAAHLAKRNIPFTVYEMSSSVAGNVADWKHVKLFTPWQFNMDSIAKEMLVDSGCRLPDEQINPSGKALIEQYLLPLASTPQISSKIRLGHNVVSITKAGVDKVKEAHREKFQFEIHIETDSGLQVVERATDIIDATGTWQHPNPMGANGLPAAGEKELAHSIYYGIPDLQSIQKFKYLGKRVAVVGSGHSAANNILMLVELVNENANTVIHWVLRGNDLSKAFGGGEKDALPARGSLGSELKRLVTEGRLVVHTDFRIHTVLDTETGIVLAGLGPDYEPREILVDRVIVATGQRPDLSMTRELRVDFDPALECVREIAPMIDPNHHSCGTVRPHGVKELKQPEANYYIVGSKSYGRATSFLLATGYEQVRSVVAYLAGDLASAYEVKLNLPETGVCNFADANETGAVCCAPQTPKVTLEAGTCGSNCGTSEKARLSNCC